MTKPDTPVTYESLDVDDAIMEALPAALPEHVLRPGNSLRAHVVVEGISVPKAVHVVIGGVVFDIVTRETIVVVARDPRKVETEGILP